MKFVLATALLCCGIVHEGNVVKTDTMSVRQRFEQTAQRIIDLKSSFDEALARGGRIRRSSVSPYYFQVGGYGLVYCFEYEQERGPEYYREIQRLVQLRNGELPWMAALEFNAKGACLSSTPLDQVRIGRPMNFVEAEKLIADAAELCRHLLQSVSQPVQTTLENVPDLPDPEKPGVFEIYVLMNPQAGIDSTLSSKDRHLHFGPTEEEWKELHSGLERMALQSGSPASVAFPLLSRLSNPYESASYDRAEIHVLSEECRSVSRQLTSSPAQSLIQQILWAISWANHAHSGLLFAPAN